MIGWLALAAAIGLGLVHVFSNALRTLDGVPRHWLLSAAGGMAVAFVVLQLLPSLTKHQETLQEAAQGLLGALDRHVYLIVLASLLVFYGLERLARSSRESNRRSGGPDATRPAVFWLHISTFAAMNVLVGYLLVARHDTLAALALFFAAMLVKFVVNDHSLHQLHKSVYDRIGRWLLATAVLLGWAIAYWDLMPVIGPAILQGILAGAVLLNVFKEELPAETQSRLWPFAVGAVAYAAVLLLL